MIEKQKKKITFINNMQPKYEKFHRQDAISKSARGHGPYSKASLSIVGLATPWRGHHLAQNLLPS